MTRVATFNLFFKIREYHNPQNDAEKSVSRMWKELLVMIYPPSICTFPTCFEFQNGGCRGLPMVSGPRRTRPWFFSPSRLRGIVFLSQPWPSSHQALACLEMGVSENSVPLNPMVLLIIIPIKWLFHWEYTLFSDKPKSSLCDYLWLSYSIANREHDKVWVSGIPLRSHDIATGWGPQSSESVNRWFISVAEFYGLW